MPTVDEDAPIAEEFPENDIDLDANFTDDIEGIDDLGGVEGEDDFGFSDDINIFDDDEPLPGLEDVEEFPGETATEATPSSPTMETDSSMGTIEENELEELDDISNLTSIEESQETSEDFNFDEEEEIERLSSEDLSMVEENEPIDIEGIDMESALDTEVEAPTSEFKIETQVDEDIPDLDEISMVDPGDIPEGDISDIPEIDLTDIGESSPDEIPEMEDLGDLDGIEGIEGLDDSIGDLSDEDLGLASDDSSGEAPMVDLDQSIEEIPLDEMSIDDISSDDILGDDISSQDSSLGDDMSTLDELDDFDEMSFDEVPDMDLDLDSAPPATPSEEPSQESDSDLFMDDIGDIEDFSDSEGMDSLLEEEPLVIEPLEDSPLPGESEANLEGGQPQAGATDTELTEEELSRLKRAILLFNPAIISEIKDTVINDRLSQGDTRRLVDMILTGKPEDNIHRFLEKKLKKKISLTEGSVSGRRKVLTSRPEYTLEGRERQKRLLRLTKIFGITALVTTVVTIASYNYIYKPWMAKKLINQGVSIIEKSGLSGNRLNRKNMYVEAEKLFHEVDRDYAKDFIYGYDSYARAYLKNKDFKESLAKLNRAYSFAPTNKEVLNSLGNFYAKTDKEYFKLVKGNLKEWYFKTSKKPIDIKSNLEMAINFYKRVLLLDSKNTTALLGIGNAYFYQGQYLKAKKYYEDILKVDSDSVVGYSGLLNLYIERDSMPMVATLHTDLRNKDMLEKMPLPLLSKLAGYYISKNENPNSNVRIDYGVTSPRFKDDRDKTYPAIHEILKAMNRVDPDYPQLQIQYARMSYQKKNYLIMERYLQKALELSPNYFSALQLMGQYNYMRKRPVQAYDYLKKAQQYYTNQPPFTKEEFYKETESIANTNKYLGNIFYYYFDRVKDRKGALDDEVSANESQKLANMEIAKQYYLRAANFGDTSPELNYNLGRIYYLEKNYTVALDRWLQLYGDFVKSPELMLSLGDAFYHKGSYGAAKGEYLKLISVMEYQAEKIGAPKTNRDNHIKVFQTLSSTYNNLGAVYQNLNEDEKRDLSYWKSIELAKKIGRENEYARINLARSHRDAPPLLDESIPYSIDYYSEKMR